MPENKEAISNSTIIRFYLHSIRFTPLANSENLSSNDVLIKVLTFLNQQRIENKAYVIDKHRNRVDAEKRELFMNSAVRIPKTKKMRCSLALLVGGKLPMVKPKDSFELVPFNSLTGSIAELTHFFIDYSRPTALMCVEYNHNGPRLSDIESYFRHISHDVLYISRATSTTTFMDVPIDDTLKNFHNVLNFEIKLRPQNITQMDNDMKGYITDFANIGQKLKPKFIRIEAMFQTPGAKVKSAELNKNANNMMKHFLEKFQKRPFHIEHFDEFEIKYQNKDGEDFTFNLLKGKKEISREIEKDTHLTTDQWYKLIEDDFNTFIETFSIC